MKLDGNVYPIQFRLHDNRFPNSPRAIKLGGGAFRSDLLALGEPGFDPINYKLNIGYGGPKGIGVIAGDLDGNLRSDIIPLRDTNGNSLNEKTVNRDDTPIIEVGYDSIKVHQSVMLQDTDGADKVLIGHGHMLASMGTVLNIQHALKTIVAYRAAVTGGIVGAPELAIMQADALQEVADLYTPPVNSDITRVPHQFPEVFGNYDNLLLAPETFAAGTWVKFNTTVEADRTISPNGTLTAELVNDNYIGGDANVSQDVNIGGADTKRYCFSTFLKPGTSRYTSVELMFYNGGTTTGMDVSIDWQTMTFTSSNLFGGIIEIPGAPGWYRMWVSARNNGSGNTKISCVLRPAQRKGLDTGDKGYVFAWGAMLHTGQVPTTYVA